MNKNNSSNVNNIVTRLLADSVIVSLAKRHDSLSRRAFGRREYRIDSEIESIEDEISTHCNLERSSVEHILASLAKAARPETQLTLPEVEPIYPATPRSCGVAANEWSPRQVTVAA